MNKAMESSDPDAVEEARKEQILDQGLKEALSQLDERSRRIISERWLYNEIEGHKGATLADLAQEFGISQERVRQIEKKALQQMREFLQR